MTLLAIYIQGNVLIIKEMLSIVISEKKKIKYINELQPDDSGINIILYMLRTSEKDQNFLGRPRFRGDAILHLLGRPRSFRRTILDELSEVRCVSLCILKCRKNSNLDFMYFLQMWHLRSCSISKTT